MSEDKKPFSLPKLGKIRTSSPRSFKQHIKRRLIILVPIFLLIFAAKYSGILDVASDKLTFTQLSWFNNTALVEHLRILITQKNMTHDVPRHCLVFLVNGDESVNTPEIEVLARHGNKCPSADPKAPPAVETLFHIKINRALHSIETDAGSPNLFHPLPQ